MYDYRVFCSLFFSSSQFIHIIVSQLYVNIETEMNMGMVVYIV